MSKKTIITSKGLEILATSSKVSGQYYWLGYYALAYVPNAWKQPQSELPDCSPDGFLLGDLPNEPLSYNMTNLTVDGDIIYNVFQGDLMGTGYYRGESDGSAGGNLFGLSMYDQNIKKHYRYVLDDKGRNTLVAWEKDTDTPDAVTLGLMKGAAQYHGTDGFYETEMAIPAPLYYLGDITGKLSVSDFFPDITDTEISGASIYVNATYNYGASLPMQFPLVTSDYRGYMDSQGNDETESYAHATVGAQFDSFEIPAAVDAGFDETSWFAAESTRVTTVALTHTAKVSDALWKNLSISNYNRFHAPVDSLGHVLNSDLASRNMSKLTKFFPISNYKVINSVAGFTIDNDYREVATGLALTVDINLAPNTKAPGYDDNSFDFDENSNLTFFSKYDRPELSQDEIYNTTHTSFKFNRIGIYAVPLMAAPYTLKKADNAGTEGTVCDVQFQIDPDSEPVLFAVVDFDNTIYISDTGDGLHSFRGDINLNLDATNEIISPDSSLIRDTVIFYNMYKDDAQTWYQNQLIATASTQNAIIELGLEVAHLKSKLGELACCATPNYDDRYALKNHTHGRTLRNLLDALNATDGGLRGIDTVPDGYDEDFFVDVPYTMGMHSWSIGYGGLAHANQSFVFGDNSKTIGGDYSTGVTVPDDSFISPNNSARDNSRLSIIIGGRDVIIYNSKYSLVGPSYRSRILMYRDTGLVEQVYNTILNGSGNKILSDNNSSTYDVINNTILNGNGTTIQNSTYCTALNSAGSNIRSSSYSVMGACPGGLFEGSTFAVSMVGPTNVITNTTYGSIISGSNNTISNNSYYAFILTGSNNLVDHITYGGIIGGMGSKIIDSDYGIIVGGSNNYIYGGDSNIVFGKTNTLGYYSSGSVDHSYDNFYVGVIGRDNTVIESQSTIILGSSHGVSDANYGVLSGYANTLVESNYNTVTGHHNTILGGAHSSSIVGGSNNRLYVATNATILGGNKNDIIPRSYNDSGDNTLINPDYAVILGGKDCYADHYGEITRSNGKSYGYSYDKVKMRDYNANADVIFSGVNQVYAKTKNSSFMLSRRVDMWYTEYNNTPYFELDTDGGIVTTPSIPYYNFAVATLDGNSTNITTSYNGELSIPNCISLRKGESMSGTLRVMVHIPFSVAASCCTVDNAVQYGSGTMYHSLISFGAHRDGHGRITVSSQLINESASSMSLLPVDSYGITTSIKSWSEMNGYVSNIADDKGPGFKQQTAISSATMVTNTDWVAAGNTVTITSPAHGLKVGDVINVIISSNLSDVSLGGHTVTGAYDANSFTIARGAYDDLSGTVTYKPLLDITKTNSIGMADGHVDEVSLVGESGTLLVVIQVNQPNGLAVQQVFSSRYIFVTAVIESLITTTDGRLYPPTQIDPS